MSVQRVFNQYAAEYDDARRRLIPCFDEFYRTVVDIVPFENERTLSVLDLGAGTGLLTAVLASSFPNGQFTLIDVAEKMLEKAAVRLAESKVSFTVSVGNYADPGGIDDDYDLIVSGLSIHHLEDFQKEQLFSNIYKHLKLGGLFVNADQVAGETDRIDKVYREKWLARVKELGCSEDEMKAAFERMKEDKMSTLSHQLDALASAGFKQVNCWYKQYSFVVYSGEKLN